MIPAASHLARLRSPGQQMAAWLETVRVFADYEKTAGQAAYGDWGQHDATLYLATGDKDRAQRAITKILKEWANIAERSRNETREYTISLALHYEWLRPEMTEDQAAEFAGILRLFAGLILDHFKDELPWGTRLGDSDEVVGHYFGLRLIARVLDDPALLSITPGPQGSTPEAMRKDVARYCVHARGGEWVESDEYNDGTLKLLAIGAHALGIEEFPDVAEVLAEVVEQLWWDYTPDYKDSVEWGDDQSPHGVGLSGRVALLSLLCGLGYDPDGKARTLLQVLTADRPLTAYWFDMYRGLWAYDPDAPLPDPAPPIAVGFRENPVGLCIHRAPEHLLAVFAPNPLGVDHPVSAPTIQLWHRGEWVLDSVRGYMPSPACHNACLLHGFGAMEEFGLISATGDANGCEIVWRTAGRHPVWRGDHVRPPAFLKSYNLTISFDVKTKAIRVTDDIDGLPEVPNPEAYRPEERAVFEGARAPWDRLWHCPVEPMDMPDSGFTWKTPGGQGVLLSGSGHSSEEVLKVTRENTPGYLHDSELTGYTARFQSAEPRARMVSVFELVGVVPPVPPAPPVPPVPPPAQWKEIEGSELFEEYGPKLRKRIVWQIRT